MLIPRRAPTPASLLRNHLAFIPIPPQRHQSYIFEMANAGARGGGLGVKTSETWPTLSDHDFKMYNHMAVRMNAFHEHFRQSWDLLWQACTTGRRPQRMTLKEFLKHGIDFTHQLTLHHDIEETLFFPKLAKKMPEFQASQGDMVRQHAQIHAGLTGLQQYLKRCAQGEGEFELRLLREKMESWGSVLWEHLDDEVKALGAENMRKYWTKEEVQRLWV